MPSPAETSPIRPRWLDTELLMQPDDQQSHSMNQTQTSQAWVRQPILKGKIDSRTVAGLKKSLNTASNFSQILQPKGGNSSSYVKLSHYNSVKGRQNDTAKPGDMRYATTSLEPGMRTIDCERPQMQESLTKFASSSQSSGNHSRRARVMKMSRRNLQTSKPRNKASPEETNSQQNALDLETMNSNGNLTSRAHLNNG